MTLKDFGTPTGDVLYFVRRDGYHAGYLTLDEAKAYDKLSLLRTEASLRGWKTTYTMFEMPLYRVPWMPPYMGCHNRNVSMTVQMHDKDVTEWVAFQPDYYYRQGDDKTPMFGQFLYADSIEVLRERGMIEQTVYNGLDANPIDMACYLAAESPKVWEMWYRAYKKGSKEVDSLAQCGICTDSEEVLDAYFRGFHTVNNDCLLYKTELYKEGKAV